MIVEMERSEWKKIIIEAIKLIVEVLKLVAVLIALFS